MSKGDLGKITLELTHFPECFFQFAASWMGQDLQNYQRSKNCEERNVQVCRCLFIHVEGTAVLLSVALDKLHYAYIHL